MWNMYFRVHCLMFMCLWNFSDYVFIILVYCLCKRERDDDEISQKVLFLLTLSRCVSWVLYISCSSNSKNRVVSKTVSVKLIIKCKSRQRNEPANYFLVRAGQWKVRWEGRRKAGGPEEARHQGISPPLFYQAATTVEASFSPWFQPDQEFHQGSNFCQKAWAARSTNPVFSIYPSKLQGCSAFL